MRKALKQLNGERRRFSGMFVRCGQKPGWKGSTLTTILLIGGKIGNKIVCDLCKSEIQMITYSEDND